MTDGRIVRFAMSYSARADETLRFGSRFRTRIGSYLYAAITFVFVGLVLFSTSSGALAISDSIYGDIARRHAMMPFLVWLIAFSGAGAIVRAHLHGVTVSPGGLEMRTSFLAVPRVRRFSWVQIHRVILDPETGGMLELWNHQTERLPRVADPRALAGALLARAAAHNVTVTALEPILPAA